MDRAAICGLSTAGAVAATAHARTALATSTTAAPATAVPVAVAVAVPAGGMQASAGTWARTRAAARTRAISPCRRAGDEEGPDFASKLETLQNSYDDPAKGDKIDAASGEVQRNGTNLSDMVGSEDGGAEESKGVTCECKREEGGDEG